MDSAPKSSAFGASIPASHHPIAAPASGATPPGGGSGRFRGLLSSRLKAATAQPVAVVASAETVTVVREAQTTTTTTTGATATTEAESKGDVDAPPASLGRSTPASPGGSSQNAKVVDENCGLPVPAVQVDALMGSSTPAVVPLAAIAAVKSEAESACAAPACVTPGEVGPVSAENPPTLDSRTQAQSVKAITAPDVAQPGASPLPPSTAEPIAETKVNTTSNKAVVEAINDDDWMQSDYDPLERTPFDNYGEDGELDGNMDGAPPMWVFLKRKLDEANSGEADSATQPNGAKQKRAKKAVKKEQAQLPGYVCRLCNVPGHNIKDCPSPDPLLARLALPDGYVCKVCNVPGHHIKLCPMIKAKQSDSAAKLKKGYVCKKCNVPGHLITACPSARKVKQQPVESHSSVEAVKDVRHTQVDLSNPQLRETTLYKVFGESLPQMLEEIQKAVPIAASTPSANPPKRGLAATTSSPQKICHRFLSGVPHDEETCRFPHVQVQQGSPLPPTLNQSTHAENAALQSSPFSTASSIDSGKIKYCSKYKPHDVATCPYVHVNSPPKPQPQVQKKRPQPLCKYVRQGTCRMGPNCGFSHDLSSLPCAFHNVLGGCVRGTECAYSHAEISAEERAQLAMEHLEFKERKREEKAAWETLKELGMYDAAFDKDRPGNVVELAAAARMKQRLGNGRDGGVEDQADGAGTEGDVGLPKAQGAPTVPHLLRGSTAPAGSLAYVPEWMRDSRGPAGPTVYHAVASTAGAENGSAGTRNSGDGGVASAEEEGALAEDGSLVSEGHHPPAGESVRVGASGVQFSMPAGLFGDEMESMLSLIPGMSSVFQRPK